MPPGRSARFINSKYDFWNNETAGPIYTIETKNKKKYMNDLKIPLNYYL